MLINEAKWLGDKMSGLSKSHALFPMLNLGSSLGEARKSKQPWIQAYIFNQFTNQKIIHSDITAGEGVDVAGDLTDIKFRNKLKKMKFRSVLCSNLLEHIPNIEEVAKLIVEVIPVGGYIFVSCPYKYPYHPNPIDNMFRPSIDELAKLFPNTKILDAKVVQCSRYSGYFKQDPLFLIKNIGALIVMPFINMDIWHSSVSHMLFLFRKFEITCIVLIKES